MRDQPRPRRRVSPTTLRLLTPFYRHSVARDAYVLRIAGGQYGPVLVDKTAATAPAESVPPPRTGRFARGADTERAEKPVTPSRQR